MYEITDKKMYQKFFIKKIKEVFSYKELINVINSNPKTKKKLKPTAKNSEITKMLTYTLFNPNFFNELPPEEALFEKRGKKYLLKNAEEDKKEESSDEEESVINRKKRNIRQKGNKRPKTVPKKEKKNSFVDYLTGKAKDFQNAAIAAKMGLPVSIIEQMNRSNLMPQYFLPTAK